MGVASLVVLSAGAKGALVDITSPTTTWTPVLYSNNNPDASSDQQTGSAEGDIIGNAAHPSVYTTFGDANTPSPTDGTLAFRVRIGADSSPAGFKTALFVGIDGNADGALDLFLGVNNSGAGDLIGLWDPGTGLNISPNTTSIEPTPLVSYTETAANYLWTAVTATNDPTVGSALDIDGTGDNDYFLSYSVNFSDVVAQMAAAGIAGFDENSTMSYVISTATQINSLNQDLNGVGKSYDSSASWSTLGVQSNPVTAASTAVVPEINPAFGILLLIGAAVGHQRWKRRLTQAV